MVVKKKIAIFVKTFYCHFLTKQNKNSNQNVKVEKMVLLVKIFDHYHHKFQLLQLPCKIVKKNWNWSLDRNLIITLLIMAICTVACKALYNFKIKRAQEAKRNQFFFQMFKIMRSLRSSKYLQTTEKANAYSPWTVCSVFNWK